MKIPRPGPFDSSLKYCPESDGGTTNIDYSCSELLLNCISSPHRTLKVSRFFSKMQRTLIVYRKTRSVAMNRLRQLEEDALVVYLKGMVID